MAHRRRFRWVLDTMVVIRGARAFRQQLPLSTTAELRLLLGWIDDETLFDWLYSQPILDEYRTILRRLKVPAHAAGRFLNLLGDFPPVPGRKRPEILTPGAAVARLWR